MHAEWALTLEMSVYYVWFFIYQCGPGKALQVSRTRLDWLHQCKLMVVIILKEDIDTHTHSTCGHMYLKVSTAERPGNNENSEQWRHCLGLDFYSLSLGFLGKLLILELKQEIQRKFLGRTQDEPNITEGSVNGVCVLLVLIFWSRDLCDC